MANSWKKELDIKYESLMSLRDISIIDQANEVILKAIEELNRIEIGVC